MKRLLFSIVLAVSMAVSGLAADASTERLLKHLETSREFTLRVANEMPPADFGYKLTPAQMSFAEQLAHIASANLHFYSTLAGEKPTLAKPSGHDKKEVIDYLAKSFDYCLGVLKKASTAQLDNSYPAEGRQMSGWDVVLLSFDHTTHHRAQCEMYLRAKGIKPPDYEF